VIWIYKSQNATASVIDPIMRERTYRAFTETAVMTGFSTNTMMPYQPGKYHLHSVNALDEILLAILNLPLFNVSLNRV